MAFLTEFLVADVLLVVVMLLGLLYYYLTANFDYWKKRGVPYPEPTIFYGNMKDQFLQRKHFFDNYKDIYNTFPKERFLGFYESSNPVLMIRDPNLIRRILVTDFSYFVDRGLKVDEENDPLAANLFNMSGEKWRHLRQMLSPTFTTGKLKGMLEQLCNCGDDLLKMIEKTTTSNEAANARKLGSSFTIDVIASCAFGLQFKPDSPEGIQFREMADNFLNPSRTKYFLLVFYFPKLAKMLGISRFPKELQNYFIELVRTTIRFRKENNIERNDFLQLMMVLRDQEDLGKDTSWNSEIGEEDAYLNQIEYVKHDKRKRVKMMTDECIAAQASVFLLGGSDVVATSIVYSLFELAINPDVQRRLQQEVDSVLQRRGGKLTYEALQDMTYLDMFLQERNRKYSDSVILLRECAAPYTLPDTDILLEKGTRVVIPFHAIHNDPAYYPEPDKFIPERFEGNNHRSSGTYLPFGDGPRMCIGMRFSLLALKVCISQIVSRYSVTLDSRTQTPLRLDPAAITVTHLGGIWVNFHRRSERQ